MANTVEANWDEASPANADDISAGALEMRVLRAAVGIRNDKQHVAIEAASVGGEHLEGSARIHTATAAPTLQVIGAGDGDVTIASNKAIAEGAMWTDSNNAYVLEIYVAEAWHACGYLPLVGGTITGATTITAALTCSSNLIPTGVLDLSGATLNTTATFTDTVTFSGSAVFSGTVDFQSTTITTSSSDEALAITTTGTGKALTLSSSTSTGNCLMCTATNSYPHIILSTISSVTGQTDGCIWRDTNGLVTTISTTDYYLAMSVGTTGGTDSAGAGNQYVELTINGTTYKVLHDGTV